MLTLTLVATLALGNGSKAVAVHPAGASATAENVELLVNPMWRAVDPIRDALSHSFVSSGPGPAGRADAGLPHGVSLSPFTPEDVEDLVGSRIASPEIEVVIDQAARDFFRSTVGRLPRMASSLHEIVEAGRLRGEGKTVLLLTYDPRFRALTTPAGRTIDAHLTVRVFVLVLEASTGEDEMPVLSRCELLFEDRSMASAPCGEGRGDILKAFSASLREAMRGIVTTLTRSRLVSRLAAPINDLDPVGASASDPRAPGSSAP